MNPRGQDGNHLPYDFPEMERFNNPSDPSFIYSSSPSTSTAPPLRFGSGAWNHPGPFYAPYAPYAPPVFAGETAQASSTSSPQQHVRGRSPTWTSVEEEILIRLYKENAEPMRKQGKKGQVMWRAICEKLTDECKDLGIQSARTWQKCKEKFFNLSKKYKQAKDQLRVSGQGSDPIGDCEHFQAFDEFLGSRDAVSPKHVVESRPSTPVTPPQETAGNDDSTADEEPEVAAEVAGNGKKGKRAAPERATGRKKHRRQAEESEEEQSWLTLFREQNEMLRESQRREELLFRSLQEGTKNCSNMIVSAIKELGNLLKKD